MSVHIAGYDIDLSTEDGMITDVIVLARVQRADRPGSDIAAGVTEHSDYITKLGMMHYALDLMKDAWMDEDDD